MWNLNKQKIITYTYSVLVMFYIFTPCDVADLAQTDANIFGILLSLVTIIFSLYVLTLCTCAAAL